MAGLVGAHKDNSISRPVGLGSSKRLQGIQFDGHLGWLTGNVFHEGRMVENDRFPMESGIQRGDHVGILEICQHFIRTVLITRSLVLETYRCHHS